MRGTDLRKIPWIKPSTQTHRRDFPDEHSGFIQTDDPALIMLDYQGHGRSSDRSQELYKLAHNTNPAAKLRRQVVGFARHTTDSEKYKWLNDEVCAIVGEVRLPLDIPSTQLKQADVKLVFDVAELQWEPPTE